jgi:hypothetical protein
LRWSLCGERHSPCDNKTSAGPEKILYFSGPAKSFPAFQKLTIWKLPALLICSKDFQLEIVALRQN